MYIYIIYIDLYDFTAEKKWLENAGVVAFAVSIRYVSRTALLLLVWAVGFAIHRHTCSSLRASLWFVVIWSPGE